MIWHWEIARKSHNEIPPHIYPRYTRTDVSCTSCWWGYEASWSHMVLEKRWRVPCVGCGRTQCVHTCPQNPLIYEQFHRQDFRVAHLLTCRQRPRSFLLMSTGALVIVLFQDLAVFIAFPSLTGLEQPRQEPKASSLATLHPPLPVISSISPHSPDWIFVL